MSIRFVGLLMRLSRLMAVLCVAASAARSRPDRADARTTIRSSTSCSASAFEGFYQYNWNQPYDRINLLRAYDTRANVFGIQQANLDRRERARTSRPAAASARASTCSSARRPRPCRAAPANEPRPDVYRHIWQAYGTYVFPVGRGLQTDFGKFASNLGYETNYAKDNNQFSRAYLFNFLPFYHSGLRVTLPVQRQGHGDVHADQRHSADRGLQQLQEQPLRGHRQADRRA